MISIRQLQSEHASNIEGVQPVVTPKIALSCGWSILPVDLDKQPRIKSWKHLQNARVDDKEFGRWLSMKPPGWAVITGKLSGVVIVDFDGEKGIQTMRDLNLHPHVQTGSGGFHCYFRHPGWHVPTLNHKSKLALGKAWPGLDVRGDGGYAVFCGRNKSGEYKWLRPMDWEDIYNLPFDLRQMIGLVPPPVTPMPAKRPATTAGDTRVATRILVDRAIQRLATGCGRNDTGFWLAQQLHDNGHTENEAASVMREYVTRVPGTNTKGQREAYTETEATATLKQAYKIPAREPWAPKRQVARAMSPVSAAGGNMPAAEPARISEVQTDWQSMLIRTRPTLAQQAKGELGEPRALLENCLVALRHCPEWRGVLGFNEFSVRVEALKATPWGDRPAKWGDNDVRLTAAWLQRKGIHVNTDIAGQAVEVVARERTFHPIRDYLLGLKWDGTPRLYNWAKVYLGAEKPIESLFARLFLISAVARPMRPGCKVDTMLVLEGRQGLLKSTALQILASDYFSDRMSQIGSKDSLLECHGVWILEHAELDSLSKSEASAVKSFMSSSKDRFRLPYGRTPEEFPRQCVFAGTTNKKDWLDDETGGRRFWPVSCTRIDIAALRRDRDQLWAEAVREFNEGKEWWLTSADAIEAARQEQSDRYRGGVWDDVIAKWLPGREDTCISDVLISCIGKEQSHWTQADKLAVSRALRACGWEQYRVSGTGERRFRPSDSLNL